MTFKKRFQHYQELYPYFSSVINFGRAIMGNPMNKEEIKKSFKLLDRNDYQLSDREDLVSHFRNLSKLPEFNGSTKPRV